MASSENARSSSESHFTRLEREVGELRAEFAGFQRSVGDFMDRTSRAIEHLSAKASDRDRTNWSVLAGWAAVIIAIVSLGMHGYVRDSGRVELGHEALRAQFHDHEKTQSHEAYNIALEWLRAEDAKLDTALQLEMRDLDVVLQREMHGLHEQQKALLDAQRRQIDRLQGQVDALMRGEM